MDFGNSVEFVYFVLFVVRLLEGSSWIIRIARCFGVL